jgi:hypothetical protein
MRLTKKLPGCEQVNKLSHGAPIDPPSASSRLSSSGAVGNWPRACAMVYFVRYWLARSIEDPEKRDARNKAHLDRARIPAHPRLVDVNLSTSRSFVLTHQPLHPVTPTRLISLQVTAGAVAMKAGWADTYLPRGFWNAPMYTATTRSEHADAQGFLVNPYRVALQDMDDSKRISGEEK